MGKQKIQLQKEEEEEKKKTGKERKVERESKRQPGTFFFILIQKFGCKNLRSSKK